MSAAVVSQDDYFSWSLNQLSREFGVARETVGRRLRDGGIQPCGTRRKHPVFRVGEAAQAILVPQVSEGGLLNDPNRMVPKERSDWYRSENDRVKFERDTGVLTSVEECREQMAEIAKIALHVLETLPDKLERDFDFPPEVISGVELMIDAVRVDMAEQLET